MKYWLHRISYLANVSYPLLDKGYLSIGFSDFTDKIFLKKVSESNRDYFEEKVNEIWKYREPKDKIGRWNLWNFIAEMHENDIVLVPKKSGNHFLSTK